MCTKERAVNLEIKTPYNDNNKQIALQTLEHKSSDPAMLSPTRKKVIVKKDKVF
jgi:hypothetical protein